MARTKVTDWSQTAALNLDIGGVGIAGNDSAKNIRPAFQEMMKQIADVNHGVPLDDRFALRNATDMTKGVTISAANVPSGQTYELDAAALYRQGAAVETFYTASGTHTFADQTTFFQIEAVGGGGGGGGVDGQGANTICGATGGGSGFFGKTGVVAVSTITPNGSGDRVGTVTVGTAGAGGAPGNNNGDNGSGTTWADGTNSFTWGGGRGGRGDIANPASTVSNPAIPPPAIAVGAIYGTCNYDTRSVVGGIYASGGEVLAGTGGGSPYGVGGAGTRTVTPGTGAVGGNASGYGAGGGGASVLGTASNFGGGDATAGLLIVREW